MGTTSDKLTYLNTTKQKLKDSINALGGDITSETTFRNYVTELDTIYDNLPKTTGEGSNLSLSTLKGRINVDDILGDTEQDTTTGINLFIPSLKNVDTDTTITKSNAVSSLTLSNNEFTFVASGADVYFGQVTAVGGSYSNANGNKINVGSATKISYRLTNTTFNRGHFTAYDSNNVSLGYTGIQGNTGTYTIPSGTSYVTFRFGKTDATSGTTYKTKVIVALGDTIPDYQDYTGGTASPNPTYPQDINVVTGKNRLPVPYAYSSQTRDGITFTINDDGSIKANGTATGNATFVLQFQSQELRNLLLKNDCMLSGCPSGGSGSTYKLQLYGYTSSGVGSLTDTGSGVSLASFENETNSFNIAILILTGTTVNNIIFKPMIEIGSQATSYLPYNTLEVVVQNRNLANNDTLVNGYMDATGVWIQVNEFRSTDFIPVQENETYSASFFDNLGNRIKALVYATFDKDKNFIEQKTQASLTISSGVKYIRCRNYQSESSYIVANNFKYQVEKGSTATSYIEHQEQTKTLHLGDIELAKIGTYQDRIFESSGKNKLPNYRPSTQTTNGVTLTNTGNGLMVLNGTASAYTQFVDSNSFELEAGTYTLWNISSFTAINGLRGQLRSPDGLTTIIETNTRATFTLTETTQLRFREVIASGLALSNVLITPMILKGDQTSTIPNYEPYGSDKWYIEKNIGKYILESAKNWQYISVTQGSLFRSNNSISNAIIDNSYAPYCNYYKGIPLSQTRANNNIIINNSSTYTYIDIVDNRYTSVDTFKTWLASNNVELLYVLATPTYEEITNETLQNELNELEKMMSYNGQTNISVSGNLPMILDVTALKGESE